MQNLSIITSIECVLAISTYLFLLIILLAFIAFILRKQEQKNLQKIIGGFGVFVIAILSGDKEIMIVALFIGGLIIASEEFMKTLVAILKAKSSDIPKILMEKASQEEKIKKDESEEKEKLQIQKEKKTKRKKRRMSYKSRAKIRQKAEQLTGDHLFDIFTNRYSKNIKFKSEYGDIIVDGVIKKSHSHEVLRIVEIKYIPKEMENLTRYYIRKIAGRIRFSIINIPILIIFVYEKKLTRKRATSLYNNFMEEYKDISIGFFNFDKEKDKVEQVLIPKEILN